MRTVADMQQSRSVRQQQQDQYAGPNQAYGGQTTGQQDRNRDVIDVVLHRGLPRGVPDAVR